MVSQLEAWVDNIYDDDGWSQLRFTADDLSFTDETFDDTQGNTVHGSIEDTVFIGEKDNDVFVSVQDRAIFHADAVYATIKPYRKRGRPQGYRVMPVNQHEIAAQQHPVEDRAISVDVQKDILTKHHVQAYLTSKPRHESLATVYFNDHELDISNDSVDQARQAKQHGNIYLLNHVDHSRGTGDPPSLVDNDNLDITP